MPKKEPALPRSVGRLSLLKESSERRNTGTRANHNNGLIGSRKSELFIRLQVNGYPCFVGALSQPTTRHTPIARPRTQYSTDEQIEKLAEKAAKVRRSSHAQEKEREKDEKDEKPKKTSMFKAFSARVSSKVTAFVEDSIIWEPKFNALVAEESDDDKAINKIIAMCNQKSYAREYIITNR